MPHDADDAGLRCDVPDEAGVRRLSSEPLKLDVAIDTHGIPVVAIAGILWLLAPRGLPGRALGVVWALPMALLLLGTPIFAIFLIGAVATFVLFLSVPPVALHQIMFGAMENYALLAVPFFIFAGELMSGSGIARRLIVWVLALIGRIPGSLGVATVGACTLGTTPAFASAGALTRGSPGEETPSNREKAADGRPRPIRPRGSCSKRT